MEPHKDNEAVQQLPRTVHDHDKPPQRKKNVAGKTPSSHLSRNAISYRPVVANFDSSHLTIGAGVATFHLATSRVILCHHSVEKFWFLPKGRRDVGEDTARGAEREGFEEVNINMLYT